MVDQAEKLRKKVQMQKKRQHIQNRAKTIAVISGKGGVGKSVFSLNFAVTLAQAGKKVLLFDLDIGMGNIELLAGVSTNRSIAHFFTEHYSLEEIITKGPGNISIISGGTGLNDFVKLDRLRVDYFIRELNELVKDFDYLLFDIGAGMDDERVHFLSTVDHAFVIVTPEITSIMDAYSAIKYVVLRIPDIKIHFIGNRMKNEKENRNVLGRINETMYRFLQRKGEIAGFIPEDHHIRSAVKKQVPYVLDKPNSPASKRMKQLVTDFLQEHEQGQELQKDPESLLFKLKTFLLKR